MGDSHLRLGPEGNREPREGLEQMRSRVRHGYMRLQAGHSGSETRRLGRRKT